MSLSAYVLATGTGSYAEVGTWAAGEIARLSAPFVVEIELDRLV